jgi:hypothetical protein
VIIYICWKYRDSGRGNAGKLCFLCADSDTNYSLAISAGSAHGWAGGVKHVRFPAREQCETRRRARNERDRRCVAAQARAPPSSVTLPMRLILNLSLWTLPYDEPKSSIQQYSHSKHMDEPHAGGYRMHAFLAAFSEGLVIASTRRLSIFYLYEFVSSVIQFLWSSCSDLCTQLTGKRMPM